METNEVSIHQVRVFLAMRTDQWLTANEIAASEDLNGRTVRDHLLTFVKLGIVDRAEVFPGHRYRLSPMAEKRNATYSQRLLEAAMIFGIEKKPARTKRVKPAAADAKGRG